MKGRGTAEGRGTAAQVAVDVEEVLGVGVEGLKDGVLAHPALELLEDHLDDVLPLPRRRPARRAGRHRGRGAGGKGGGRTGE